MTNILVRLLMVYFCHLSVIKLHGHKSRTCLLLIFRSSLKLIASEVFFCLFNMIKYWVGFFKWLFYVLQYGYTWCRKLAAEQLDELVGAMSQPVADPGSKPTSRMVNNTTFKNWQYTCFINQWTIVLLCTDIWVSLRVRNTKGLQRINRLRSPMPEAGEP